MGSVPGTGDFGVPMRCLTWLRNLSSSIRNSRHFLLYCIEAKKRYIPSFPPLLKIVRQGRESEPEGKPRRGRPDISTEVGS